MSFGRKPFNRRKKLFETYEKVDVRGVTFDSRLVWIGNIFL